MNRLVFLAPLVLTGACFDSWLNTDVKLTDDAAAAVQLKVGIAGNCTDHQTVTDENGTTTWDEVPTLVDGVLQQCTIDVSWDGDLISLAKMHQDAIDQCGTADDPTDKCDPATLDLSMSFTINDATFAAGAEAVARDQLIDLSASARTGDAVMFAMDKSTPLPLALDSDPGVKAALRAAYLSGGKLPVHAQAHIVVAGSDVRRMQEASPDAILTVDLATHLEGTITAHL